MLLNSNLKRMIIRGGAAAMAGLSLTGCSAITQSTAMNEATERTMESAGYDTPELAVQAYLEAFQQANIQAMVSAYAVETY